jgi:Eukaryotic aspartyl protease
MELPIRWIWHWEECHSLRKLACRSRYRNQRTFSTCSSCFLLCFYHTNSYTKLLYLPSDICNAYYSAVPGAHSVDGSGYVFPCGTELPDFRFNLDSGYTGVLPGSYLNYSTTGTNDGNCVGGIQNGDRFGVGIVGDMLLKSQFVVFEAGASPRLGFAAKHL